MYCAMKLSHLFLLALSVAAAVVIVSAQTPLSDLPFAGSTLTYLDGSSWTADNGVGLKIKANVPGDLITDLQNNNIIGEPYLNQNWIDYKHYWVDYVWNYNRTFDYDTNGLSDVLLVFEGVKMGATVTLNGVKLGNFASQFLLYNFSVNSILKPQNNVLIVSFPSGGGPDVTVQGQFMACSAGWDWAPTSVYPEVLSKGIWKSVYLVGVRSAAITYIVPQIKFTGSYPTKIINQGDFQLSVKIHYYAPAGQTTQALFSLTTDWKASTSTNITITGSGSVTLTVPATSMNLWWPVGYGKQTMYRFMVGYKANSGETIYQTRSVGFRVFALVTDNDSRPSDLLNLNGSGQLLMRFRINGANIAAKGANFVPMDEFEGRLNATAFRYLLQSMADGNMNTVRIWGGGTYLSEHFYNAADEIGIMIFHDLMYSDAWMPTTTPTQSAAIVHNVRRIASHPSLVVWSGCNECFYYDPSSYIMPLIVGEDSSRPIWGRSPSQGWDSGVDRLYGIPNGQKIVLRPVDFKPVIDQHGDPFYFAGFGWPTFTTFNKSDLNCPMSYIQRGFSENYGSTTGVTTQGKFISEFGASSMSSFESMTGTLDERFWGVHTTPFYQRNYPIDNFVVQYFNEQNLNLTGAAYFAKYLYMDLIGQAIHLKGQILDHRADNVFGTLVWQLNEIWPTGGWGMVEYGTPTVKGQVIGGRWKPAMYLAKMSAFPDFICSCTNQNGNGVCFCKNEGIVDVSGTVTVTAVHFKDASKTIILSEQLSLAGNQHKNVWFCLTNSSSGCSSMTSVLSAAGCSTAGTDCMLVLTVADKDNYQIYRNEIPLATPGNMQLPAAQLKLTVVANNKGGADVTIYSTSIAAYVVLTTRANGRFLDNAMMIYPGSTVVPFIAWGPLDMNLLSSTIRVEHAQQYITPGARQLCNLN